MTGVVALAVLLGGTAATPWFATAAWAQGTGPYVQVELGQHTAPIRQLAVDRAERWLVTASDDKTARVWALKTRELVRILRPPIGDGNEGRLYAVAISPDGERVVVGGFTGPFGQHPIYLFDRSSGKLIARSADFDGVANQLAFSPDGSRVAAVLGTGGGTRILRASNLTEIAHHADCGRSAFGVDFDIAGRLVATCNAGLVHLYNASGQHIAARKVEGGDEPNVARFSPDGSRIAVGFLDSTAVTVVSARDLSLLYRADTQLATSGNLAAVAWSSDGKHLLAAGTFDRQSVCQIVVWPGAGRGVPMLRDGTPDTILDLVPLRNGGVVFASGNAAWGVLGRAGSREHLVLPAGLDHRNNAKEFRVAPDGRQVEFGFDVWDGQTFEHTRARFDLDQRKLDRGVTAAANLTAPRTTGLPVGNWQNNPKPTFRGQPIPNVDSLEKSQALAITRDASGFVLGTSWSLRFFDASGHQRWVQDTVATPWSVNVTDDHRFVLAALADGTIRWYEAATGRERLVLFVHASDGRWVLWTPEGFYAAAPGADGLFGYHLNQGPGREGQFVDAGQLAGVFYRPDLISRRLDGDEAAISAAVSRIGDVRTVLTVGLPPRLELLSPAVTQTEGDYELLVRVTPTSGGVGPVRVRINGSEVAARGTAPPGGGTVSERLALAPGRNVVGVVALTRDGKVASPEVRAIVTVKAPAGQPVLRVLAVGISYYVDASFRQGVKFAAGDAQAVAQHLTAGARGVYRSVDAVVLSRPEETRLARIEGELKALASRARPEDVVVIFLAGHGKAYEGEYHFIPSDFLYDNDQAIARGGTLSHSKLEGLLKDLGAGKRLLILDTCHSAAAIQGRDGSEEKDAIARLMRSSGRYILAAASPQGKALEDPKAQRGVYTRALMEGLAGAADPLKTGRIEVDDLAKYVAARVPKLTEPLGYIQVPMRSAAGESFWITRPAPQP